MERNAFVVMPFGTKAPRGFDDQSPSELAIERATTAINFEQVWERLLKPALERAGCNAFRTDSGASAGDIRTDMFFELVTADLVVADVTIANPNVFYELGVRHGSCDRGVFVVTGNVTSGKAFDIAQDRTFAYDGQLFLDGTKCNDDALVHAIKQLSSSLAQAIAADQHTVGSPVYSHLPGLVPASWENIQTSTARHFHALQDDWLDCVRRAQYEGHPGDILTLAEEAPTRLHRTKILYEAALALINLCRYPAAEKVLRDVIAAEPNWPHAELALARALAHQNKTERAEHTLRTILRQHEDDPHASDLLGQVFRSLWHLAWKKAAPDKWHQKAVETAQLARQAITSFLQAFRLDPRAYYAGFNALILGKVFKELTSEQGILPGDFPDLETFATVVEFIAANERKKALERGDYEEQFWATTTLAGIALVRDQVEGALARVREAFCVPGISSFQLQSFRERLQLLHELNVKTDIVRPVLLELDAVQKDPHCKCRRVVLFAISEEDDRKLSNPELNELSSKIAEILEQLNVNGLDLAICSGTKRCDIIFAERILERNAAVRLMIMEPEPEDEPMWPFFDLDWLQRFHSLVRRDIPKRDPETSTMTGVEVWYDNKRLGALIPSVGGDGSESSSKIRRFSRHMRWMINTARIEAAQVSARDNPSATVTASLNGIFVLADGGCHNMPLDVGEMIRSVNEFEGYRGEVEIISPLGAAPESGSKVVGEATS